MLHFTAAILLCFDVGGGIGAGGQLQLLKYKLRDALGSALCHRRVGWAPTWKASPALPEAGQAIMSAPHTSPATDQQAVHIHMPKCSPAAPCRPATSCSAAWWLACPRGRCTWWFCPASRSSSPRRVFVERCIVVSHVGWPLHLVILCDSLRIPLIFPKASRSAQLTVDHLAGTTPVWRSAPSTCCWAVHGSLPTAGRLPTPSCCRSTVLHWNATRLSHRWQSPCRCPPPRRCWAVSGVPRALCPP